MTAAASPAAGAAPARRRDWTAAAVSAAAFLILLPGVFWGLPFGKFLVGADVLRAGGVLYRDVWTMYAPGSFYLVAGLNSLFGREVIVQAIATVLLRAVATGVFWTLLRRVGTGRGAGLALSAIFCGMFWETSPELDTYPPALLLILLALARLLRAANAESPPDPPAAGRSTPAGRPVRDAFLAGLLCGAAALFKHDIGAYTAIGGGVFLLAARCGLRPVVALAGGAVLPLLPVAALIAASAGPEAADGLLVFPATVFRHVFGEPYPSPLPGFLPELTAWLQRPRDLGAGRRAVGDAAAWITAWAPAVAWLAGAAAAWRLRRDAPARARALLLALILMPFFWQAAHVQRNTHIYSMAVLTLLIVGAATGLPRPDGEPAGAGARDGFRPALQPALRAGLRAAATAGVALYAGGLFLTPAMDLFLAAMQFRDSRPLGLPGTAGIRLPADDARDYRRIVRKVQEIVAPGQPLWVGLARHDAPVITNLRFYYLARRPGATRYYELHPGVTDTAPVQQEIIAALEEQEVAAAVLWRFGWPDSQLDRILRARQRSVPEVGAEDLDRYLAENFTPAFRAGEFTVLRRGAAEPPAPGSRSRRR